jgi:hypothetical protein
MYHAEGEKVCVTLLEREWCGYVKIDLVWPVDSVAGK